MLSREAQGYGDNIGWQAKKQFMGKKPLTEDLEVTYFYYFIPSNKKRDHLNYNKLLNDRLNQILWVDDQQIKISHHYTKYDKNYPRTEIFIKIIK
jgi:Holliday junction resolvase RusA-like endonuclease